MPKLKLKANELEDVDVSYISLVKRPANRIPFRVFKGDIDKGAPSMINLNSILRRKGDKGDKPVQSPVAGLVVHKADLEEATESLKAQGFNVDSPIVQDDVVVFKQYDFSEEEVTAVKMDEQLVILTKGFEPYSDGMPFADVVKAQGFLPGVSIATEAMMHGIHECLRKSDTPEEAQSKLEPLIKNFSKHVIKLANTLPSNAFAASPFVTKSDEAPAKVEEPAAKSDESTPDSEGKAATEPEQEPTKKSDEAPAAEAEGEAKKEDEAEGAASPEEEPKADPMAGVLSALSSFKDEISGQFKTMTDELASVKKSSEAAAAQAKQATEAAEQAQQKLKGTVMSGSDSVDKDNAAPSAKKADDLWAGSALDNLG